MMESAPKAVTNRTLEVRAESRTYPIVFGENLLQEKDQFAPYLPGDKVC